MELVHQAPRTRSHIVKAVSLSQTACNVYMLVRRADLAESMSRGRDGHSGAATDSPLREVHRNCEAANPHRRLTTPEDVARYLVALCHPATYWMTGNTLRVDGGESIVG